MSIKKKTFCRAFSWVLVCVMVLMVVSPLSNNTAEALGTPSTLSVATLWNTKRDSLGWCKANNTPTEKMWENLTGGVTEVSVTVLDVVAYKQLDNSLGRMVDTSATVTTTDETLAVSAQLDEDDSLTLGDSDTTDTTDTSVTQPLALTSVGASEEVNTGLSTKTVSIGVADYQYQGYTDSKPNKFDDVVNATGDLALYYTVEYDTALVGYYRRYYVSTSNQLATLLYYYENDTAKIKAQSSETDGTAGISKLGIALLCDIDLGGSTGVSWYGYRNQGFVLDFDGQGNTIYNGYFSGKDNCFLGRINKDAFDRKFSIRNVTFSHMFIGHDQGMFGGKSTGWAVEFAYFENVDFEYCMAVSNNGGTSIVLGGHYAYCYFKNCTVRNSYAKGNGHTSTFATYNPEETNTSRGTDTAVNHRTISYLGDTSEGITSYYYTSVPSLEEAERAWYGKTSQIEDYKNKPLSKVFPTIYENCATIDCEIYDTLMDSGTFISCQSGFIIFKNCFTNSTMYGTIRTGVFLGSCMEASDGFYYEFDGKREFTNSVFESCYSSGSIEGTMMIGGFVGSACNDDQARQKNSSDRGKLIFNNCYSTSSVGLQYAGTLAIGGFVGDISGNSQGEGNKKASEDEQYHIIKNCYAAGEVGNILTCTDTQPTGNQTNTDTKSFSINDNNSVGGFIGTYDTEHSEINVINCYYDKQTTGMRERDIGCASTTGKYLKKNNSIIATTEKQLCGTLGITGAYTQTSKAKDVVGLTDTKDIMGKNNTAWTYTTDYYPQLSCFDEGKAYTNGYDYSNLSEKMEKERELLYYRCSLASTAAVFLDHYDEMLDESGNSVSAINQGVYDTVRDITSKFTFTSTCNDTITWEVDTTRNTSRGFASQMKEFTMDYKVDGEETYTKTYTPKVLTIQKVDGVYKCFDFAPGKQWVKVDISGNDEFTGSRQLRLLPMAYLNAGNIITVSVSAETSDTTKQTVWKNQVSLINSDNEATTVDTFNHAYGVVYAITERARMLGTEYTNQKVSSYSTAKSKNDNSYFALYGGYLLTSEMSNSVGLNPETGKMYAQNFNNLKQDSNQSTDGMTMVKIYKASASKNSTELIQRAEVDVNNNTTLKSKWEGKTPFDRSDAGYYYLHYYWRLNDGRYLEDIKLVYISENTYTVEAVTGILNQEHTVDDTLTGSSFRSPVDQYVSSNQINENSTSTDVLSAYPSTREDFTSDTAASYYVNLTDGYEYNNQVTFDDGGTYYVKSIYLIASNHYTVVGWHNKDKYQMTTLIVEAHDAVTDTWYEMSRIDERDIQANKTFDFNNAEYQYEFSTYSVTQDNETKLFNVTTNESNKVTFRVNSYNLDMDSQDQYIVFSFSGDDDVTLADIKDDLRVTVLFRDITAKVSGIKSVLLETDGGTDDFSTVETYKNVDGKSFTATSLQQGESYKSVDNSNLEEDDPNRVAVLSGDTLTYRVKLQNDGVNDADDVVVTDKVPDGCTLVDDSLRIYRQEKDITGKVKYDSLERLDTENTYTTSVDGNTLTWTLPKVELTYDYYVEFRVTVDDIDVTTLKETLTNQANWQYHYHTGSAGSAFSIVSDPVKSAYTLKFTNDGKLGEGDVTVIGFSNIYDENFTPKGTATLTKTDSDGNILSTQLVTLTSTNNDSTTGNEILFDNSIELSKGETLSLYIEDADAQKSEETWTKGTVSYTVGNSATSSSIIKTERLSNIVKTDVTWTYLNLKTTLSVLDPTQSFVVQVDYYPTSTDVSAEPTETFYVRLNCTEPVGNVYTGSQLVQLGKRGTYVVTELEDLSNTLYQLDSVTLQTNLSTKTKAFKNPVTVSLSLETLENGSFYTVQGTNPLESSPIVTFVNVLNDYASISNHAYAENTFQTTTD